jgi:MOSC domain-containing protein YiiM
MTQVPTTGRLIGLARREAKRAPMETLERGRIGVECGLEGDFRGLLRPGKEPTRQVTMLGLEGWEAACAELGRKVPWTTRRANLLVEGVEIPRRAGPVIAIGDVRLQIMGEVKPCRRMEEAEPGLDAAMRPDWRGGVGCRVLQGGDVRLGDPICIEEGAL